MSSETGWLPQFSPGAPSPDPFDEFREMQEENRRRDLERYVQERRESQAREDALRWACYDDDEVAEELALEHLAISKPRDPSALERWLERWFGVIAVIAFIVAVGCLVTISLLETQGTPSPATPLLWMAAGVILASVFLLLAIQIVAPLICALYNRRVD